MPTLANNKKAFFNYQILEELEAGIVLSGAEVKSVKNSQINLAGSYISIDGFSVWLINAHISPYKPASGNSTNYNPTKKRKLLLKKQEISRLIGKIKSEGLTLLPISVYTKGSLIKLKIAVCRGKKKHDKRAAIKKRESERKIRRVMRNKA